MVMLTARTLLSCPSAYAGSEKEANPTASSVEDATIILDVWDADLLPDDWEIDVGLDPTDPSDAEADIDLGGLPNLPEFILGLDPFNADTNGNGNDD